MIATFIALYAFGFSLNFLTLMALSLCIGLLIDDAIVVRENIVRHLAMGKDHKTRRAKALTKSGSPSWRRRSPSSPCSCRSRS